MQLPLHDRIVLLATGEVRHPGGVEHLTELEAALLAYLVARPGEAVSREALHRDVWGYAPTVQSRAVDFTMSRLRKKLEADPARPRHLLTARSEGYRFAPVESRAPAAVAPGPPLLGRARTLADVRARLDAGARLVTLHGLGGMGKSAVLRAVAEAVEGSVRVELDAVLDPEGALRDALGLPGEAGPEALRHALDASAAPLLVLDGVAVSHRGLVASVAGGRVPVLVSARAPLGLEGEHTIALGPLDEPSSVALLTARLTEVRGPPTADDTEALRSLAARLCGWPLAIELAASRGRLLSPAALAARVDPLSLRDESGRGLRAIVEQAVDALAEPQRAVLAQCALFPGDLSLDAAEAVIEPAPGGSVLDALDALCARSLLHADEVDGGCRLRLPGPARPVAAEVLGSRPEAVRWRARRDRWAADHAASVADHLAAARAWRAELDAERPTLRALWEARGGPTVDGVRLGLGLLPWLVVRASREGLDRFADDVLDDARAIGETALARAVRRERANVLRLVGRYPECLAACDALLAEAEDPLVRFFRGATLRRLGQAAAAAAELERARAAALAVGDPVTAGRVETVQALLADATGDADGAEALARAAVHRLGSAGAALLEASVRVNLAVVLRHAARYAPARHELERAEAALPASGSVLLRATVLHERAQVEIDAGCLAAGEALALEELATLRRFGDRAGSAWPLSNLGVLAIEQGDLGLAAERLHGARALHAELGSRPGVLVADANLGILALFERDRPAAARRLRDALALGVETGTRRYEGALRAFLAFAEGRLADAEGGLSAQDARLYARLLGGATR